MTASESAFNDLAKNYDSEFTQTELGQYYRARVQDKMEKYWPTPQHLLELNAGTGEDATFLASCGHRVLATDMASSMIAALIEKVKKCQLKHRIETKQLAIEQISSLEPQAFDGVLSNFGGINCVDDWGKVARETSTLIKDNGYFIMVVMGPWVPWEWGYFLLKGQYNKSFRRLSGQCQWRNTTVYYPSIKKIKAMMMPHFNLIEREALGLLMPPSYAAQCIKNKPRISRCLAWLEHKLKKTPGLWQLGDHYLLVFEKR